MTQLDRIEQKVDSISVTLHGEPAQPGTGMVTRVDRLEQAQSRRAALLNWMAGLLASNFIALVGVLVCIVKQTPATRPPAASEKVASPTVTTSLKNLDFSAENDALFFAQKRGASLAGSSPVP